MIASPSRPLVRVMGVGRRTFSSLRHRDFALLWTGTAVMSAGQWLQQVTLSWLLFEMTGSAFQLGLLNGLRFLPFLFTSLIGGVLADRMDRRRLMFATQAYVLSATAIMAVLLLSGRVTAWHLFAFTFLSGIGWSMSMPVRQSLVPALVPREDVYNAVALTSTAFNLTRAIGPAFGGLLMATLGGGGNFVVQVAFYAVVLVTVAAMRVPAVPVLTAGPTASAWGSMKEGLRYVRDTPSVGTLLLLGLVPLMLGMSYQSLLPIFAADVYHIGAGGLGALIAVGGLGSFLATLAVVLLLCVGASQMTYSTINQTQLQTVIADGMRGRVMSLYMLNVGLVPAGSFAAGVGAELVGAPVTVSAMGALIVAVTVFAMIGSKHLHTTSLADHGEVGVGHGGMIALPDGRAGPVHEPVGAAHVLSDDRR